MRNNIVKLAIMLALGGGLFLTCSATAREPGGKDPVLIGGTLSLTGKYAAMGKMQEKGFRLWETEINQKGGLLGRPVKLILTDDASDPKKVADTYTELLQGKKVDLAFSPYSSELTLVATDLAEKYRFPFLVSGAASEKIWETPRRYTVGLYSTTDRYFIGFLELCAINKKKTVSITGFPDPFSLYVAKGAKKWAEKFGLKVVRYNILEGTEEKDFNTEVAGISSAKPDVVIVAGYMKETIGIRKALDRANLKNIAFAGSVGPAMQDYLKTLGPLTEGDFGASQWEPDERIPYPGSRTFIQSFRKAYGEDPSYHAAAAYASMKLVEEAVRKTGSLDREKVRQFFVTGEHRSILGPFKLRKDGTQIGHKSIIIQWQRGKKEIVWPESMRTARPVFPK
ncbi:MAG: branched-chain amino acid transporter substrate-binding protein, partial [Actinobacteria bacterium]|nr:branched-chain amino acid transporter substrate-binding protein [Actinomycetota bacterium]